MIYRKLKRTWSHNDANYIPNFKKVFPELSKVSSEELCDRLIELKMDFYYEKKEPVKLLTRLTMPFAIIVMVCMFFFLPINFMIKGEWGYGPSEKSKIFNWLKSLRIV